MIARIVGRLLAAADQPNQKFTVTILDTAEVNAFALPGGYVYVTRGILALASDTSARLAAVLSHEIAHVTLKHARARTNRVRTDEIVDKVVIGRVRRRYRPPTRHRTARRCRLPRSASSRNWPPTRKAS